MENSPASPSKSGGGILKTPGTISRRKSVTFNQSKQNKSVSEQAKETPKEKQRTSILMKNFPGKYPSPYTPRTRSPVAVSSETDLVPSSQSPIDTIAAHIEIVLENNS